jgi:DNA replicative helicase MCM subunit Mcm2 (Cdc46/Mcm family)
MSVTDSIDFYNSPRTVPNNDIKGWVTIIKELENIKKEGYFVCKCGNDVVVQLLKYKNMWMCTKCCTRYRIQKSNIKRIEPL